MAIVSVTADAGLRRSEAAALTWRDIERQQDGSGRLTFRCGKTDPGGAGTVVAITPAAMSDLDRLNRLATRRSTDDPDAPVFGLSDRQIARRIAQAARTAGLGDGFSGRVGMAQRMTRNNALVAIVMRQGRWTAGQVFFRRESDMI